MKRYFVYMSIVIFALTAFAGLAHAIEKSKGPVSYTLNGYYKNLLMVSDTHWLYRDLGLMDKRWFLDDYNRLRLKNELAIGSHFKLVCDYEAFISNGDTILAEYRAQQQTKRLERLGIQTPVNDETIALQSLMTAQNPPRFMDLSEGFPLEGGQKMAHDIDRLFLQMNVPYFDMEVGRMAISWGTGRIWNPTDLWAPFSPTEIDKDEKRGVDIVHATVHLGTIGSLEGVYAPLSFDDHYEIKNEDSSAAGRFAFHIGEFDISMMGGTFSNDIVTGFDFSGYIWDAGFRGEAAYTFTDPDLDERDYLQAVLSLDYGFSAAWNPYLLIEGFYNGMGESDPDDYLKRLSDQSVQRRFLMGRTYSLGRDYLTIMSTIQPHALVTISLQPVANLDDQSMFVAFNTKVSVTDYADVIAGTNIFAGPDNSEYGGIEIDMLDVKLQNPDQYYLYLKAYF